MNLATTIELYGYGTSEGVEKSWDTRGRGIGSSTVMSRMGPISAEGWLTRDGDFYGKSDFNTNEHGKLAVKAGLAGEHKNIDDFLDPTAAIKNEALKRGPLRVS